MFDTALLAFTLALQSSGGSTVSVPPSVAPGTIDSCANPKLPRIILAGLPPPSEKRLSIRIIKAGSASLVLAVAVSLRDQELGLACVQALQRNAGMLYVFPNDAPRAFWMKDTIIPLDMIFVRADGTIDSIAADMPASSTATPDVDVARYIGFGRFVLEVHAGLAKREGLKPGQKIDVPIGDLLEPRTDETPQP